MTDRRTDGRTHDDSIHRASIASRGNKSVVPRCLFELLYIVCVLCFTLSLL